MTIGIFDSGVGGLWILKHIREAFPEYNYIFIGDQAHVPYGSKSLDEIRNFSEGISDFLINDNCEIIVIACNTASAASLKYLRNKFPETLFIGMEPAVKPAVQNTQTGKVGVLATPATFQGELYNSVVERFKGGVELFENTCLGLVEEIEKGEFNSPEINSILEKALLPMLKENIDTVVLGCTHYPFVIPVIQKIIGEKVRVIDPTPAIVRRIEQLINENNFEQSKTLLKGDLEIYTSGDLNTMSDFINKIFDESLKIKKVKWDQNLKLNVLE